MKTVCAAVYVPTAQMMPPQHSIFAAEIAWPAAWHDAAARNDTDATPVLEDMVVPYVTALRGHAGSTPCVIVGYSFHASMAFEIAHQLLEQGGQVDLVMILDAPAEYPLAVERLKTAIRLAEK